MALAVDAVLRDSDSIASPGVEQIEWSAPVRPGDALSLAITVLSKRISSNGEYGIVRWQWSLTNQSGTEVMSLSATNFFAVGRST